MPKTPHVGAFHINEHQVNLDSTLNSALNRIDKGAHGLFSKVLTSDDYELTPDEAEQASYLRFSGAFTADRTVTLPNNLTDPNDVLTAFPRAKHYVIENSSTGGFELTITTVSGTGVILQQGTTQAVYCDGVNCVAVGPATGAGGVPYDVICFVGGLPGAGSLVLAHRFARAVTFAATLPLAKAYALTTATGAKSFDVKRQIPGGALTTPGTVNFAIGANSGTFTWAADVTYAVGDVLLIYGPAVQDATLADVAITLTGVRS
jgi:hypothetical protein